jgi:hypothetical protein
MMIDRSGDNREREREEFVKRRVTEDYVQRVNGSRVGR